MKSLACQLAYLCLITAVSGLQAQPADHHRLFYAHPLTSATPRDKETIRNLDGVFDAERGWHATQTTSQLQILLSQSLPLEGTLAVKVTNFNPAIQWVDDLKLHVINLYSRLYPNNKDIFDTDGAWIQIRTGSGYSAGSGMAGFKVLAAARGISSRNEFTCLEDYIWKLGRIYEFRIAWTRSKVYVALDNAWLTTLNFSGQIEPFNYILLGRDNLIYGYCAQVDPWYFDLRVYEKGEEPDTMPPAAPLRVRVQPLAGVPI
ncbi:MAG TPA: hypothetical protein PLG50_11450 [bacterium]|nr:hypothetical protein [bacterium]HQG46263.1 hypothetical protein [bacterium]HQI49858.1 hypothetical protein [bacterium]HQJ65875.1 hypothetical protein [bacterium]